MALNTVKVKRVVTLMFDRKITNGPSSFPLIVLVAGRSLSLSPPYGRCDPRAAGKTEMCFCRVPALAKTVKHGMGEELQDDNLIAGMLPFSQEDTEAFHRLF